MAGDDFDPTNDPADPVNAPRSTDDTSLMFDPGSFQRRWWVQGGKPGLRANLAIKETQKQAANPPPAWLGASAYLDPGDVERGKQDVVDYSNIGERESGLRQAYEAQQGINQAPPLDPTQWEGPLAKQLAQGLPPENPNAPVVPDQKKKESAHDTQLGPEEVAGYRQWAKLEHKVPKMEEKDYDLRGFYKDVIQGNPDLPPEMQDKVAALKEQFLQPNGRLKGGHLPDTYKKPTHPTFSDESIYSGNTMLGNYGEPAEWTRGGHWSKDAQGRDMFTPGPANYLHHSDKDMMDYFRKYEPGIVLDLHGEKTAAAPAGPKQRLYVGRNPNGN